MKKRKFPAGLVIGLVVLLGGAGAYSVYNTTVANRSPEENQRILMAEQAEQQRANAPKPDPSAKPVAPTAQQVRQQLAASSGGKEGDPEGRRPGGPGDPNAQPGSSIIAPKAAPYKPVPNESATSSQWYEKK